MANGQANGQSPSQPQQPDFFHDLAAGKIPDPLAPKTSGTAAPTAAPKTPGTTPAPAPAATSDFFHDLAAGKIPDPLAQTGTPKPSGDIIDRAVAGTFLEPINRGIEQGVAAGFGLKAPDPNHPESLTFADAAKQTWNNLTRSASRSYEKLGGLQPGDKEWDEAPIYRLDIPVHSALAAAATPFHMAAMGIDGMASLLEEGGKEFINGIKTSDHQTAARGFGKVLASLGQIAAGAEAPEAAGKAVGTVGKMAEYNPREVQGSTLTGAARPANVMQGAINRSVGAFGRDVRFGDPSRALIEEGVAWPGTKGRLAQVNGKLFQLSGQLRGALQSAKGTVDLSTVLDPLIKKYKDMIRLSAESDEVKAQAYKDLDVLRQTAAEHAPSGQATAAQANALKQAVGDAVNWEKRQTPMHDAVADAYREAYGQLKDGVNGMIGKDGAELNRRVSNLMAAKNSLKELTTQQKAGRAPSIDFTQPTASVKSAAGHVAPAVITGAQKAAATAKSAARTAAQVGTMAEGDASRPWRKIQTSDGAKHLIHPEDLPEAQRRDPGLKILDQQ